MSEGPFENSQKVIEFLFGAENRISVLLDVSEEDVDPGHLTVGEVKDSTYSNKCSELEEMGLLNKKSRGEFELTPVGEVTANYVHNWLKDADRINNLFSITPFLKQIDILDEFFDKTEIGWLADSEIAVQDEETGRNNARDLYWQTIDEANEIREIIHRTYDPEYVRTQLVNGGLESIYVVSNIDMEETVRSDPDAFERWKEMYNHGSTHISVDEIPIDYSVSVFDGERVGILPTNPGQGTQVYLVSSHENVVKWASNLIQRYAQKGEESVPVEK